MFASSESRTDTLEQVDRFRALGQAFAVAFDPRKAGIMIAGTIISSLVALVVLVQGLTGGAWFSVLGAPIIGWIGLTLTQATIAELSFAELSTGRAVPFSAAFSGAVSRLHGYLLSPVLGFMACCLGLLAVLLAEWLVSVLGHLPAGEILISLAFIPVLIVNILLVPAVVVVGWLTFPAIASRQVGAIGASVRVLARLVRQPAAFIQYAVIGWMLAQGGLALLVTLFVSGLFLAVGWLIVALGPDRTLQIAGFGSVVAGLAGMLGPVGSGLVGPRGALGVSTTDPLSIVVARDLLILGFAIVAATVFSFPGVYLLTSGCSAFLALWPAKAEVVAPASTAYDISASGVSDVATA